MKQHSRWEIFTPFAAAAAVADITTTLAELSRLVSEGESLFAIVITQLSHTSTAFIEVRDIGECCSVRSLRTPETLLLADVLQHLHEVVSMDQSFTRAFDRRRT
jgi:hypothetical protein